jgi:BTB/POZ domain-containing protein KCTD9
MLKSRKTWFRTQQRHVFRFIQRFPTWLAVTLAVFSLSFLTIWFHDDLVIRSPQDLLTRPVLKVLFENAESIAIVAAVVLYFKEAPDRKDQKHYEAWQVIDSAAAAKVPTSYARIKAFQDLNEDGVSLKGVDVPGADLAGIVLLGADLSEANLSKANLSKAILNGADLNGAILNGADLNGAILNGADLNGAILNGADLNGADLIGADLKGVKLIGAKLIGTYLNVADFSHANLSKADFSHATLSRTTLSEADVSGANFRGAKNLMREQITAAQNWETAQYDEEFRQELGLPPELKQTT